MSELAAAHYATMAKEHSVSPDDLHPILNGEPLPLLAPATPLPVRNPNCSLVRGINERYAGIITGLGHFLVTCAYPDQERPDEIDMALGTSRHITGMVSNMLKPYNMPTGFRTGLQTQAVAPGEINDSTVRDAFGSRITPAEYDDLLARSVILLTAADVHPRTTRNHGYIAFVSVARAVSSGTVACSGRRLTMFELAHNKSKWRPTP